MKDVFTKFYELIGLYTSSLRLLYVYNNSKNESRNSKYEPKAGSSPTQGQTHLENYRYLIMSNSTAAKVGTASNTSSRRSKKSQEVSVKNTSPVDGAEAQQESSLNTDKGAQVIAMPQIKLQEAPKEETVKVAVSPLPGNRPIDSGNIKVLGSISQVENRPIVASNIKVLETISVSGERPIAASTLNFSETNMIMPNRPIASNYIEGEEDLMGYLD